MILIKLSVYSFPLFQSIPEQWAKAKLRYYLRRSIVSRPRYSTLSIYFNPTVPAMESQTNGAGSQGSRMRTYQNKGAQQDTRSVWLRSVLDHSSSWKRHLEGFPCLRDPLYVGLNWGKKKLGVSGFGLLNKPMINVGIRIWIWRLSSCKLYYDVRCKELERIRLASDIYFEALLRLFINYACITISKTTTHIDAGR